MVEFARTSGITVSVTGPVRLAPEPTPPKRSVATAAKRAAAKVPGNDGLLLDSLSRQGFDLADSIPFTIPPPARPKKRGGVAPTSTIAFDVPLGPDERAVVLLEDEGEYRWIVDGKLLSSTAKRSGKASKRQMRFSIEITAAPSPPSIKRGKVKRNWLTEKLVGKVVAHIFRFVVKFAGKKLVAYLERKVEQGLVAITTTDPQKWRPLDDKATLPVQLPADRPARILLLVHGTFSSTTGSFGALGITPQGVDFLTRAAAHYDAILGFDHATLSVDPLINAKEILKRLRKVRWPQPPHVEIVCFSRGALVARSLIEYLLPASGWAATVGSVVFVGSTNGGTQLAEPDNWHRFVDHYTNLALGATRALSLVPGAQGVSAIVGGAIRGVGILVKVLATSAITDKLAPGLAAMEPDGEFVRKINAAQAGQPTADQARYFAVTSDFETRKALSNGGTPELPPKFLLRIADWGTDRLYGEANDLVVHVRSMTQIDPGLGGFIKDTHEYGSNGVVYHTNYFAQDKTASRMTEWLRLPVAPAPRPAAKRGRIRKRPEDSGYRRTTRPRKPVAKTRAPGQGSAISKTSPTAKSAGTRRAPKKAAMKSVAKKAKPKRADKPGVVRVAAGKPVEISRWRARPADWMVPRAKRSLESAGTTTTKRAAPKRAGMPVTARKRASRKQPTVECHFRAEMDSEIVVDKKSVVEVTIARHALEVAGGRTSATGTTEVDPGRKLIVQISERRNLRVIGERQVEVDVPEPGKEAHVMFDVTGVVPDAEGELWVQARQGPVPLVTLKLKSRIAAKAGTRPAARLSAMGAISEFPPDEAPIDQLIIEENFIGNSVRYLYLLDLPSLQIRRRFESSPIQGRDDYVKGILDRVGAAWAGTKKNQIKAFERDLRAIGASMFEQLMPLEMRSLLWGNRNKISGVQVSSMEPFIPWELVCLKNPGKPLRSDSKFLGELGMTRWPYEGYPPARLRIRKSGSRYVIPEYSGGMELPDAAKEEQMMKDLFNASRVKARANDVQQLLLAPGRFDLLHFAGHAEAAGDDMGAARLILDQLDDGTTENTLSATTVGQVAQLDDNGHRPVVVLNACESARMNRSLTGIAGFAPAFVKQGAGLFIGSLWSVGDAPALTFIKAFYESFAKREAGTAPLQLRDAVTRARQAAKAGGDGTWLAYAVYGHPRAVIG